VESLAELEAFRPPLFSDRRFYAVLAEKAASPSSPPDLPVLDRDPDRPSADVVVDLKFGEVGKGATPKVIDVGTATPHGPNETRRYSLALVNGTDMAVVKGEGGTLAFYDLSGGNTDAHGTTRKLEVIGFPTNLTAAETTRLVAVSGWFNPPLAATRSGGRWLAAWLTDGGVWAVEADNAASTAKPIVAGPLMSGEKGGTSSLTFTNDGSHLMLLQHQMPGQVKVRIWDLRSAWLGWLDKEASEQDLVKTACHVLISGRHREESNDADRTRARLLGQSTPVCQSVVRQGRDD
jgi:hypothetical protein